MFRPDTHKIRLLPSNSIKTHLETKLIENLYFSGQINGTTGYEEKAVRVDRWNKYCQKNSGKEEFILSRSSLYWSINRRSNN